ncbi:hypothetical protein F511_41651 [Dorcoceras hygrometricum]|uniref:Uncharacterized protein n=1 Tax=Dorcoceras hygrometricum TaxID=472368 RepID=A0A2Z7BW89_9LAMI|nr:hypothetical protein F511_41651 [Dorcoceras hygrometricum]
MATVEWIQQKRKDKDSADGFALRTRSYFSQEESAGSLFIQMQQHRGKSSRKHLKPTTGQPAASISSPAQPVASSMHSVASFAYPVDMVSRRKKSKSSEAWKPGAKYPVDKETAVARSVVTKNKQQLSEQLLNNLLENIQPLQAINAQDGKNQWLK